MDLAMAWQMLELKSTKYCNSSMAADTLDADFPLDSVQIAFN